MPNFKLPSLKQGPANSASSVPNALTKNQTGDTSDGGHGVGGGLKSPVDKEGCPAAACMVLEKARSKPYSCRNMKVAGHFHAKW